MRQVKVRHLKNSDILVIACSLLVCGEGPEAVGQKCLSAPCEHSPLHTNVPLFPFFLSFFCGEGVK